MIFAVARRKMYIEIIGMYIMYENVHYVRKCTLCTKVCFHLDEKKIPEKKT